MHRHRLGLLLLSPLLLIAPRAGAQEGCSPARIGGLLMRLFPPMGTATREESARELARCRLPGAVGALTAALQHDPALTVQLEAATALAAIRTPAACGSLQSVLGPDRSMVLRRHTIRLLVASGDAVTGLWIVSAADAEDELRAEAFEALVRAGENPKVEPLVASAGPALLVAIQRQREEAAAAAAGLRPQGSGLGTVLSEVTAEPVTGDLAGRGAPLPTSARGRPRGGEKAPHPTGPLAAMPLPAAPLPTGPLATASFPATRATAPTPAVVIEAPVSRETKPVGPPDGTPLAVTTSIIAGSLWGGSLSLLAQQDSVGVVTLVGTAGAVIGGGTAWGLTRFGLRPSPSQAMWFTNTTGWGTLAGLMAWAGSGSDSPKLKYGLLVGGETVGLAAGLWSARRFAWTPQQVLMANSLVVAGGVGMLGIERWRHPTLPLEVSPLSGYGTAPLMLVSAFAARQLEPSASDVHLATVGALGAAWTTGLLASGAAGAGLTGDRRGQGGMLAGLGLGYLAASAAGPFTEVRPGRTYTGALGLITGNLLGLGVNMLVDPHHGDRWKLGAGLGGLAMGSAAFAAYPYLAPGPRAPSMTTAGALYGVLPWTIALAAASTGQPADARAGGGQLALGTTGAIAGYLAARHFQPDLADQATTLATTALGMGAGAGLAKLTTEEKGLPELVGVLGGAATGLAGGALLTHRTRLRAPELGAGVVGAGYGLLFGSLAPTLARDQWTGSRHTAGGSWLGLSAGAAGGALLARAFDAEGRHVGLPAAAGLFGLAAGVGTGLMWPDPGSQPARVGAFAGPLAFMTTALLADRRLRLSEGLGPSAPGLGSMGVLLGGGYGWLVGTVTAPDGYGALAARQRLGGLLAGASVGAATGLVLSKSLRPSGADYLATAGAGLLGTSLGSGLSSLMFESSGPGDRRAPALTLGGASLGLLGGALAARATEVRAVSFGAGVIGAGYGAILGTLVPTLDEPGWDGGRRASGGAQAGLALGGLGAATAVQLTGASGGQLAVVSAGSGLGLLAGLGTGFMIPSSDNRPARIGMVAGTLSFTALSLVADRGLRLHEGLGPAAANLAITGGALGLVNGALLAGALDRDGLVARAPVDQTFGGALAGTTLGLTSGLLLSKVIEPSARDTSVALGASLTGALLGRGIAVIASEHDDRDLTLATMSGSLAGFGVGAAVQRFSPLSPEDTLALGPGLAVGALVGALAPSFDRARWGDWQRSEQGGLMAGLGAGAFAAVAARHATRASAATVGWASLGAADGLLTGLGVGLLLDEPGTSRGQRIGAVAGAAGGLGLAAATWGRRPLDATDRLAMATAIGVGGWTAALLPQLGHASGSNVRGEVTTGALLAGAGGTSFLAVALVPRLEPEQDLVLNALFLDVLLTGAGAGAGALASTRDDAIAWGMLGAGTAGLVLGGALHRQLALDADDAPLLTLATLEGGWYGAWLPHLLHREVTSRQQAGGVAAGALGAAGLAILASPALSVEGRSAGLSGLGSAMGASIAGGGALMSSADNQTKTALLLGGTTVGLATGALLGPRLELREGSGWFATSGAALGATEALVFAWAGRSASQEDYAGAALVGAGVGTTLGLAGAAYPSFTLQRGLASAGYAAWGAWIGSFSGALANRDPHEVTLGGLAGANLGFLAGYGLLRSELVEPRDFGWLSLAGAVGTVAGGGLGAALSSKTNPRPILAGLAIGPAVGMAGGAFILPMLRKLSDGSSSARFFRAPRVAGMRFAFPRRDGAPDASDAPSVTSAEILAQKAGPSLVRRVGRRLDQLVGVGSWTPMVGSLPPAPGAPPGPPPFLIGVAGTLR